MSLLLGDLVVFWNYDIQTVFYAVELSTNSLRAFVQRLSSV